MNVRQVAFAAHRLGLTFPELLALHHALDTPENYMQRVKTELFAQGFEVGFNCTHPPCARIIDAFIRGQSFVKHHAEHVDCFEFESHRIWYWYNEISCESMPRVPDDAFIDWERRQFIINGWDSKRVDCGNPEKVIQALLL